MRISSQSLHGKHCDEEVHPSRLVEKLQKSTFESSSSNYQLLIDCMAYSAVNTRKHPLKKAVCEFTMKLKTAVCEVVRLLAYLAPPTTSSITPLEAQSMFI
jgi:hypothetical protein